jgi:hypothetical protein
MSYLNKSLPYAPRGSPVLHGSSAVDNMNPSHVFPKQSYQEKGFTHRLGWLLIRSADVHSHRAR